MTAAAYNLGQAGGAGNPQRWTWENPTLPGDERNFWQQGHPQAKSGTGDGTKWDTGMTGSAGSGTGGPDVDSRLFFEGTVNPSDMDLATDDRQRGYMGIFGTNLNYAGSAPQVRNDELGVTLNPGGSKPDNAYLPGLEPPGWNDGLWQLMNVSNIPGQDPPGDWRDSHNKPMLAVGPGEPDPWADLPPFAQRPMVAFGPGEDNPYAGWSQLPMGAGAGTGADIGFLPGFDPGWFTGPRQPMGAGVDSAYLPGTEPPGWNAGARQLMGAGPSTCAAMPPGSESIMPASPGEATGDELRRQLKRRSEAEHKQDFMDHLYGRGSGVGSFTDGGSRGGVSPGYDHGGKSEGGGSGPTGLVTMTVGHGHPDIVLGYYYGDGPASTGDGGAFGNSIANRYGQNGILGLVATAMHDGFGATGEAIATVVGAVAGALYGAYVATAKTVQGWIDTAGGYYFGTDNWQGFKGAVKKFYDNPITQLALWALDWEAKLFSGLVALAKLAGAAHFLTAMGHMVSLEHGLHDIYLMERLATGEVAYVGRSLNWWTRTAIHVNKTIHGIPVQRGAVIAKGLKYLDARALEELIIISNPHFINRYHSLNPGRSDYWELLGNARRYAQNHGIRIHY